MDITIDILFISIEVNINVSKSEIVEINGFFIQGLQFVNNNSVELFSFKASLSIDPESVCAVVFLNRNRVPVAVSTPLRYRACTS